MISTPVGLAVILVFDCVAALYLRQFLIVRAARRPCFVAMGSVLAWALVAAGAWYLLELPYLVAALPQLVIALAIYRVDSLVQGTGGPRQFESLLAIVTSIDGQLGERIDQGAPWVDPREVELWQREVSRWQEPDTAEFVANHLQVLAGWPQAPSPRDEALIDLVDELNLRLAPLRSRFKARGADIREVARLRGYPLTST